MSREARLNEIKQQIAQLEWQRKQNDRLIKLGLESSKSLKAKDAVIQISLNNFAEKSTWQNAVIRDELSRPLVLSDQEMGQLLKQERISKERLQKYYETKHSATVKLISTTSQRSDAEKPHMVYRLEELNKVQRKVVDTLNSLSVEKPPLHNKFSGFPESDSFQKFMF